MAFRVGFDDVVIDTSGNALSNVEVSVYKVGTTELETIYNERVGGTTKTNPFTTTSNGRISFYIESPRFDIKVKDLNVPERFTERTVTVDRVSGSGSSAQVLVANAGGLFVPQTMSGEVLISNAGVTSFNSPLYATKRTIHEGYFRFGGGETAGTFFASYGTLGSSSLKSGSNPGNQTFFGPFPWITSAYSVPNKTTKLSLNVMFSTNAVKPTQTFTFGLYPVTTAGASSWTPTLGTVVSGSTVAVAEPAASTVSVKAGSEFTPPSEGGYFLGCVTNGTITTNVDAHATVQLLVNHV